MQHSLWKTIFWHLYCLVGKIVSQKQQARNIKSVLIVANRGLGDFVETIPFFFEARKCFSTAKITLLTRPNRVALLSENQLFDEVIEERSYAKLFAQSTQNIKKRHFDITFFCFPSHPLAIAKVLFFSRIQDYHAVKWHGEADLRSFWRYLITDEHAERFQPTPLKNLAMLEPYGHRMEDFSYYEQYYRRICIPKTFVKKPPKIIQPYVIVHPGSTSFADKKCWPEENFIELIRRWKKYGLHFYILGNGDERHILFRIKKELPFVDLFLDHPLSDLILLLRGSNFFIGNDSGPAHLASALGIKTVMIGSFYDPEVFGPFNKNTLLTITESRDYAFSDNGFYPEFLVPSPPSVDKVWKAIIEKGWI